jgi:hypothetical protein
MNDEKVYKKRGRKPKGGKIIDNNNKTKKIDVKYNKNIILHLNCFKEDIDSNLNVNNYVYEPYKKECEYQEIEIKKDTKNEDIEVVINEKLNDLENKLNKNNITKRCNCFWCTYSFDTPSVHIPTKLDNDIYEVYGNFCSPECASAYLFKEHIDDVVKYERYQLLNYIYGSIYNYNKNIKLAPNPYYILDKYYGNLNINEYRKLLKYERLLLITDKPLTRIFPELHQDNCLYEPMYVNKIAMRKQEPIDKNKKIKDVFNM